MPTKVYGHFARREIFFYRTLREVTKLMNYQHISKKTARLTANGSFLSVIPGPSRRKKERLPGFVPASVSPADDRNY